MKTGAMVVGIIGGVVGLILGIVALMFGGLAADFGSWFGGEIQEFAESLEMRTFIIFILSILGIVGGALVKGKTGAAAALMLISAIGGFIAFGAVMELWLFPGIMLIIGGILALVSRRGMEQA